MGKPTLTSVYTGKGAVAREALDIAEIVTSVIGKRRSIPISKVYEAVSEAGFDPGRYSAAKAYRVLGLKRVRRDGKYFFARV
jgi:hypothetical protein